MRQTPPERSEIAAPRSAAHRPVTASDHARFMEGILVAEPSCGKPHQNAEKSPHREQLHIARRLPVSMLVSWKGSKLRQTPPERSEIAAPRAAAHRPGIASEHACLMEGILVPEPSCGKPYQNAVKSPHREQLHITRRLQVSILVSRKGSKSRQTPPERSEIAAPRAAAHRPGTASEHARLMEGLLVAEPSCGKPRQDAATSPHREHLYIGSRLRQTPPERSDIAAPRSAAHRPVTASDHDRFMEGTLVSEPSCGQPYQNAAKSPHREHLHIARGLPASTLVSWKGSKLRQTHQNAAESPHRDQPHIAR